ncbi:di-heme oxidoredictase family protein [Fontimonas sp. SYSU GA230001]|uniref:di-heme oxidoredictase family protein n=1 Tax=Fontimonas sp. SYSU GA230001 TaxID=3142450 RepID=UPI0032B42A8E
MKSRHVPAALAAGALLTTLWGCSAREDAASQSAVLDGYRRIAAAAYADSLTSAEALLATTRRFVAQPDAAGLEAARAAWIAARRPYAQTEALRFGNWVVDDWETQVNAWPLDEGLIDYVEDGYAPSDDNPLARADLVHADAVRLGTTRIDTTQFNPALLVHLQRLAPVETSVAVGYHAIEFLLWGQDRSADGPGDRPWTDYALSDELCTDGRHRAASAQVCRRRADYLLAVVELLISDLRDMQRHWTDDVGSYGMRLVRGAPREGLRRMLFGLSSLAAVEMAGERIEVALHTRAQEEEQDCFSDQTHDSLRHNLLGIANFWTGTYRRSDGSVLEVPSLRTLIAARDTAQARRIDAGLAAAREAAARIGGPFDRMILDEGPDGGRARLRTLADALRALAAEIERAGVVLQLGPLNPASTAPAQPAPGGATTALKRSPDETLERDAFSQPAANLDAAGRARFMVGNSFFTTPWVAAPASTTARDGLGPLYNASACQHCHIRDGRGHPPDAQRADASGALLRIATGSGDADPVYGRQIQDRGIAGVAAEARIALRWEAHDVTLGDGTQVALRRPVVTLEHLAYGPPSAPLRHSLRIAPPMIGLGLLEAIDAADIRAGADPQDRDGDGISGRVNRLDAAGTIGRFGWKAAQPGVRDQVVSALRNDMGLTTTPGEPQLCTPAQTDCLRATAGGDPEVAADILDALVFYASHLAVPARRWQDAREVRDGERLFHDLGCAACHRPQWRTSRQAASAALADQVIAPYTDLLLHDLGEGLADGVREGDADGREWRTPPLWGLHLTKAVSGAEAGFLHDGRARTLEEAILWHGGEAQAAQAAYRALPKMQRDALVWFLKSL